MHSLFTQQTMHDRKNERLYIRDCKTECSKNKEEKGQFTKIFLKMYVKKETSAVNRMQIPYKPSPELFINNGLTNFVGYVRD